MFKTRKCGVDQGCRIDAAFSKLKADIRHLIILQTLLIAELMFIELYLPS